MHLRRSAWLVLILAIASGAFAQSTSDSDRPIITTRGKSEYVAPKLDPEVEKDKRYALELRRENKLLEALPWYEKVVKAEPKDAESLEGLAACLLAHTATVTNPDQKKAEYLHVREVLLQAQKLGYSSDYVETLLAGIPADGSDVTFSVDAEVDRIMKRAEADFSAGKFEEAKKGYLQALVLEPNNYDAVLYMGDAYFALKDYAAAGQWFSRAVTIKSDRETAYRYWGDALSASGKLSEARQKYIEAVVAEPYKRSSWNGINKWVRYAEQPLTWYHFKSPNRLEAKENGNMDITIDSTSLDKKDGSGAWFGYEIARAAWRGDKFKEEFPNEKQYRHTLKEESEALSMVAELAEERASGGKEAEKLNDELAALVKLKKAGLIEAYVLFNAADAGIIQDYELYRREHRDKLIQYLDEIVVPLGRKPQ